MFFMVVEGSFGSFEVYDCLDPEIWGELDEFEAGEIFNRWWNEGVEPEYIIPRGWFMVEADSWEEAEKEADKRWKEI